MTVQIPSSPGSNLTASWRQEDMTTHRARGMCLEPLCKAASVVSVAAVEHERPFPLPFRPKAFEAYRAFAVLRHLHVSPMELAGLDLVPLRLSGFGEIKGVWGHRFHPEAHVARGGVARK
eukprot:CAMPEP_0167786072 /NCGR_PEP_ID=MMETSP0111_2-20121227/8578_1 /TAXON_ID=91324 /ORGANISM="Lotharella globosa, Strain CCCM811" /LENGTH=119 /DNA_ID=CAMNT_0007677391 /DNA_START=304 /DNA_END=663 /DNA_ORIENTATION=-